MACTGPSEHDRKLADKAWMDIVLLLKEKYDILNMNLLDYPPGFSSSRHVVLNSLRRSIHECFVQHEAEMF